MCNDILLHEIQYIQEVIYMLYMFEKTIYLYAVICSGGMQPDMLWLQKYG